MSPRSAIVFAALLLLCLSSSALAAPFFDAIYAAINGNGRRSYPAYSYGSYGHGSQGGYHGGQHHAEPRRQGKSYKDICRVHNPQGWSSVCPY